MYETNVTQNQEQIKQENKKPPRDRSAYKPPPLGRCEKWKFGEMYCHQMKLGASHKNKIVLEKEKE